jgi:hypothetical protein
MATPRTNVQLPWFPIQSTQSQDTQFYKTASLIPSIHRSQALNFSLLHQDSKLVPHNIKTPNPFPPTPQSQHTYTMKFPSLLLSLAAMASLAFAHRHGCSIPERYCYATINNNWGTKCGMFRIFSV